MIDLDGNRELRSRDQRSGMRTIDGTHPVYKPLRRRSAHSSAQVQVDTSGELIFVPAPRLNVSIVVSQYE